MLGIVLFFGLIHGLGFANAFKALVSVNENTFLSVIEFAIGIEIGQLIIVFCVLFFFKFYFPKYFSFFQQETG